VVWSCFGFFTKLGTTSDLRNAKINTKFPRIVGETLKKGPDKKLMTVCGISVQQEEWY